MTIYSSYFALYVYFNKHQIDFNQTIQIYLTQLKFIKHVHQIIISFEFADWLNTQSL